MTPSRPNTSSLRELGTWPGPVPSSPLTLFWFNSGERPTGDTLAPPPHLMCCVRLSLSLNLCNGSKLRDRPRSQSDTISEPLGGHPMVRRLCQVVTSVYLEVSTTFSHLLSVEVGACVPETRSRAWKTTFHGGSAAGCCILVLLVLALLLLLGTHGMHPHRLRSSLHDAAGQRHESHLGTVGHLPAGSITHAQPLSEWPEHALGEAALLAGHGLRRDGHQRR